MKKAILSVSNKTGIVEFAKALTQLNYELYSTGGTKRILDEAKCTSSFCFRLNTFSRNNGWPC
ncbi:hypothetical protein ACV56Z_05285 [Staphylococcus aureus]